MKNSFFQEILISSVLVILLILFLNPLDLWMPSFVLEMMIVILIIVFSLFAALIWKEDARDEREAFHRRIADRVAFLAGSGMLVIGIIVQDLKGSIDFWLVFTLSIMIFAKIIGLIYSRTKY